MTNEEAAALVADAFEQLEYERGTGDDWSEEHEARDMAIRALLSSSEKPNRSKPCRKKLLIAWFKKEIAIKSPSARLLGYEYEYDYLKAEKQKRRKP